MAEKEYQRLTRARLRRAGFFTAVATRSSLWLGKDHLLRIDSNGYGEDYKRFYFRDIQAVILVATKRRLVLNWILGVPTAFCIISWAYNLVFNQHFNLSGVITGVVLTLMFGVPLLVNNLRGPTCTCQLRTAVQTEDLPSLNRFRRARKILDRLRPLIAAAQGQLAPEEIPARMQELVSQYSKGYIVEDPNAPPRIRS